VPRLVYADWLDERGDPRGEFIRVQCELARLAEEFPFHRREPWRIRWEKQPDPHGRHLAEREQQLRDAYETEWVAPLKEIRTRDWKQFYFVRGLVGHGWLHVRDWSQHADAVLDTAPLMDSLDLRGFERQIEAVAESRPLERIRHLTLEGYTDMPKDGSLTLGPQGAAVLAGSPHLSGLRELRLRENEIGDEGVRHLARSSHLGNLTLLDLERNSVGDAGLGHLLDSRRLAGLRYLNLQENLVGPDGLAALLASPRLKQWSLVDLRQNRGLRLVRSRVRDELPPNVLV
jgi:hypothetical protein